MTVSISKLRNPSGHQLSKVVLQFALYMTHSLAGVELNKGNWFTWSPLASLREDGQQSGKPRQNMVKRSSVPLQSSTIYFYFPITYPLVTIICSKRPTETEFYLHTHCYLPRTNTDVIQKCWQFHIIFIFSQIHWIVFQACLLLISVYVFMSLFTGEAPRLAVERGWLVGGLCWLRVCSLHDIQRRAARGNTR